jgi:hypothetical protein
MPQTYDINDPKDILTAETKVLKDYPNIRLTIFHAYCAGCGNSLSLHTYYNTAEDIRRFATGHKDHKESKFLK